MEGSKKPRRILYLLLHRSLSAPSTFKKQEIMEDALLVNFMQEKWQRALVSRKELVGPESEVRGLSKFCL